MTSDKKYSTRELKAAQVFGVLLLVGGFYNLLHGGLSLLGGFGLERHMAEMQGRPLPSEVGMTVEVFAGLAVMLCGLSLYFMVKRLSKVDILREVPPEELPPCRRMLNRLNGIAIIGAIIWIASMIFMFAFT